MTYNITRYLSSAESDVMLTKSCQDMCSKEGLEDNDYLTVIDLLDSADNQNKNFTISDKSFHFSSKRFGAATTYSITFT